jgi:threonyl-tRNA synthetase
LKNFAKSVAIVFALKKNDLTKKTFYAIIQLVCGDNEVNNNLITYRKYGSNQTTTVTTGEFITMIKQEIQTMGR